jgi:hypothetical protein
MRRFVVVTGARGDDTMSELQTAMMADTAAGIESQLDSASLERFRATLTGPLAVVASGGSFTTALLWAHLHETSGHASWAMTPYAFSERVLPRGTRVLFLSAAGQHHDVLRAAELSQRRGFETRAVTCRPASALATLVAGGNGAGAAFSTPEPRHADGLIAVHGIVTFAVIAARMYAGAGPWTPCFDVEPLPLATRRPGFIVAFGAGAAEAAAVDFANKCQESGVGPAWHTDVRHFSHGQWMSLRHAASDMLLVAFATRSQRQYLERFASALPASIPLRRIEVDSDGAAAALTLLARAMRSFEAFATCGPGTPSIDMIPAWCRTLYELEP